MITAIAITLGLVWLGLTGWIIYEIRRAPLMEDED